MDDGQNDEGETDDMSSGNEESGSEDGESETGSSGEDDSESGSEDDGESEKEGEEGEESMEEGSEDESGSGNYFVKNMRDFFCKNDLIFSTADACYYQSPIGCNFSYCCQGWCCRQVNVNSVYGYPGTEPIAIAKAMGSRGPVKSLIQPTYRVHIHHY